MSANNDGRQRQYWLYRIDKTQIPYFKQELDAGRLRQGWGWLDDQDLRKRVVDEGAFGNISIYKHVKKGDILLVPRLPDWGRVSIVEATEDFDKGYDFRREHENSWGGVDYGHIFPAKLITTFVRSSELVTGDLRKTLRFPRRFKWIYYEGCGNEIERLINADESKLITPQNTDERMTTVISEAYHDSFDEKKFQEKVWDGFHKQNNAAEWEYALIFMLKQKFPFYDIQRTGGAGEQHHGTDILISLPGLMQDYRYAIAIQVKDYNWIVGKGVIDQINKAENWNTHDDTKLIDKIVIITSAKREENSHLIDAEAARSNREVKFIFAQELHDLLNEIAKKIDHS